MKTLLFIDKSMFTENKGVVNLLQYRVYPAPQLVFYLHMIVLTKQYQVQLFLGVEQARQSIPSQMLYISH